MHLRRCRSKNGFEKRPGPYFLSAARQLSTTLMAGRALSPAAVFTKKPLAVRRRLVSENAEQWQDGVDLKQRLRRARFEPGPGLHRHGH